MMQGYRTEERTLTIYPNSDIRLDLELFIEPVQGEEVVVTAERIRFEESVEISRTTLSFKELHTTPAFIETDVFRSIQLLPAVSAQNDFSAALIVRGGSPDENLILLDGIEVYNPYHIGGVFSTFNPDAVTDADFIAGGFPAEFGGRLSSVLRITSKDGDASNGRLFKGKDLGRYFDLSQVRSEITALSSKFLMEGPFYKGSWMLSFRRTYFDQLAKLYYFVSNKNQNWLYYFWDSQFKIHSDLDERHRLTFSCYNGKDRLRFLFEPNFDSQVDFDWAWGNHTYSLKWRYVPNSRFFSETSLAYSQYAFDLDVVFANTDSTLGKAATELLVFNKISDWTLKNRMYYFWSRRHTLTFGWALKILGMRFVQDVNLINLFNQNQKPYIVSVFAQDQWRFNALLNFQFGLRLSKYELHRRIYIEPRFGLKYLLDNDTALKFSWGIYHQFLFTTNPEDEIVRIVDFWQPIPRYLDAEKNQHFVLGIEHWFGKGLIGSIEAYYKPYHYVLDINPNSNPALDTDDYIAGQGRAAGIELLIRKTHGRFTGWLGYALLALEKRIDFNSDGKISKAAGEVYPPKYYRPHTLNLVMSYQFNNRHSLSLTWSIAGGQPYTPVIGRMYTQSGFGSLLNPYMISTEVLGLRNSARYPTYLRGDIGWIFAIRLFGSDGNFKLQIINFTNHFNALIYSFHHRSASPTVRAIGMFPIIPSLGVEFRL
jgi:hypothetical protein